MKNVLRDTCWVKGYSNIRWYQPAIREAKKKVIQQKNLPKGADKIPEKS